MTKKLIYCAIGIILTGGFFSCAINGDRPNILWVIAEDASPHISCYGDSTIQTPHLDRLAAEGVRFDNAFVTGPVCSAARSALITGMYQTTLGAHNHRSQRKSGKGSGNTVFYGSYRLPDHIKTIPELFRLSGYYTSNGNGPECAKKGKTDYNFITDSALYDGFDWRDCPPDQPFFAQIQLDGGKYRRDTISTAKLSLPPYYPQHPDLLADWASYLASWQRVDEQVGQIITDLEKAQKLDRTAIFFLTDHGISHLRGKQFLYDEGIRIPLIVRLPGKKQAGIVRTDLVSHIDVAAVSLDLAGIKIPAYVHARNFFSSDYQTRKYMLSARDRCDETIDIIRSLRDKKYKYIRNFLPYRPHMQFNQYKDGKQIAQTVRQMQSEGRLNTIQNRLFTTPRPFEELYDTENDPFEINNLAGDPAYGTILKTMREKLYHRMLETEDMGLVPEPQLEELGRESGNKHAVFQDSSGRQLLKKLIGLQEAARTADRDYLRRELKVAQAPLRYWAATWLGVMRDKPSMEMLRILTHDPDATVQIAAALALCRLDPDSEYFSILTGKVTHPNLITGMYAMNAIEQTGAINPNEFRDAVEKAINNPYEFTRRYGNRLKSVVSN